jgi:hypothetical protein
MKYLPLIMMAVLLLSVFASSFVMKFASAETGLVGYWKFDEGTGTTASDSSGNGNTGTSHNGPTWVNGKYGRALSFDGIDDYVEVLDSPELNPSSITIMAWVNFRGFPLQGMYQWRNSMIISKGTDVHINGHYCLFTQLVNEVLPYFQITESSYWTWVGGTTNIVENQWYHLAGSYNGSVMKVYVNGVLEGEQSRNDPRTSNAGNLQIGALRMLGEEYWTNGTIDEVKIYNRALDQQEIQMAMQLTVGGVVIPIDKFGLLAPYIGLTSAVAVGAVIATVAVKRKKENK